MLESETMHILYVFIYKVNVLSHCRLQQTVAEIEYKELFTVSTVCNVIHRIHEQPQIYVNKYT